MYKLNLDRETKTFTETKTTKAAPLEAIEVQRMEGMSGTEKVAILSEVSHKLTIVARSTAKNKTGAMQVVVSKDEPVSKLIKMTSYLQSLATVPPNQHQYNRMLWDMPAEMKKIGDNAPNPFAMVRGGGFATVGDEGKPKMCDAIASNGTYKCAYYATCHCFPYCCICPTPK